jgi:hypothetical protein
MGYYVTGNGSISFRKSDEEKLVRFLKDLNHRHELKTGGKWPKSGDPYEDSWFAWMPQRYHEDTSLTSVADILELLGFEVNEIDSDEWMTYALVYDNKTGAEDVFIKALADNGADVNIEWTGEDGEHWQVMTKDGVLAYRETLRAWSDWSEYTPPAILENYKAMFNEIANAFVADE